ncbi:MAG: hypothetical protein BRC31_04210 [Actinobacteria bacterium QS_5_72_10]|nr:MAG: hypothetical protein BRC31_04210 [Actinobacteria bacterium QS_5_72_10]
MGKSNQQRRAAKKRKKQQRARGGPGRPSRPHGQSRAHRPHGDATGRHAGARGDEGTGHHTGASAPGVGDRPGRRRAGRAEPGSRARPVGQGRGHSRKLSAAHGDLVAEVAVVDGRARAERGESLHPRWEAQLAALADRAGVPTGLDPARVRLGVQLLAVCSWLPPLTTTVPPPGEASATAPAAAGLDEQSLARVRGLLAKAEVTEFDEEAEALTEKAQELIARHAVDEALAHAGDDVGEPSTRRIPVDPPYAEPKAAVLTQVGEANRCRVVYSHDLGWVTAIGYEGDLDAIELLATSLLVQATATMARHGSRRDASGRSRTQSFRRSFLFGFAGRIGQRLREATEHQTAEAAAGDGRLLPVLSARDERLDAAVAELFPDIEHRPRRLRRRAARRPGVVRGIQRSLGSCWSSLDGQDSSGRSSVSAARITADGRTRHLRFPGAAGIDPR